MAEFLNKEKLLEWIPRIIETSEKELIIVSPYIQVSDKIISLLKKAEKRSVEITLIYKEGELSKKEREKFDEIENLNLLFHSNLHSKCLYNEKYLLLTSMNLYEYSQKHNREMGVLFRRTDDEANGWNDYKNGKDDDSIFQDAIEEIRSILSSSDFEKESFKTKTNKFDISIIKSDKDFAFDRCDLLNKFSKNKKFIVFQDGEEWLCRCDNFVDNVHLIIENNRISIELDFDENRILNIYEQLKTNSYQYDYRIIDCFRMFWTSHKFSPKLYSYTKHKIWDFDQNSKEFLEGYFKGLKEFFKLLKPEIAKPKK